MKTARDEENRRPDLEDLVAAWQARIYDLARRLLGNDADAADATQEVFARLFKTYHRLDSGRDPSPWIYRVATNVIRNFARNRGRHRKEVRNMAELDDPADGRHPEMEEEIRRGLSALPADELAAVVLHYYHGLTQVEVARALSIPRTSVQSRLGRALESMRATLLASGVFLSSSELTAAMQGARLLLAPPDLGAALVAMAERAAPVAVTPTTLAGGLIVTKQLIVGAVLVGAISLGIGFTLGRVDPFGGDDPVELSRSDHVAAQAYDSLAERHDEAARKLARAEAELSAERDRHAATLARLAALRTAADGQATSAEEEPSAEEDDAEPSIDWSRFSALFARNLDILARVGDEDDPAMTREEEAAIATMMSEVMRLTAAARSMSDDPVMDQRIFPGLVDALFGESVGLTDAQRANLAAVVGRELASTRASLGAEHTALERHHARMELVAAATEGITSVLRDDQRARFDEAEGVAREVLDGNYSRVRVGLGVEDGEDRTAAIVGHWDKAYSLTEDQRARVAGVAGDYMAAAEELLRRHGRWGDGGGPVDAAGKRRLVQDMYRLQVRHEKRVSEIVTARQRAESLRRLPRLFEFHYGRGVAYHTHSGPGF